MNNEESRPSAVAETAIDLVGTGTATIITAASDIKQELAAWRTRLDDIDEADPAMVAACQRLGRLLGGAA